MKKIIYFLLSLTLSIACSRSSIAQSEGMLTGTAVDEKNEAIGFVNVAVLDATGTAVVTGAIADLDGNFKIKSPAQGKYLLKLSGLGYLPTQTLAFVSTGASFQKDFGKLVLQADVKTLSEVTVQGMRPTIVNHPDKMVVSVEGTAMASGATAFEVLAKSPGVWVDQDGNIQLNGKAGVQIMLNGKLTYLSGKELQNLLQGMSAENIKDLEIITNPSAKYEAEGASGIININLKKDPLYGMNGSIYGGHQYNRRHTYTGGGEISYKSGKWNSFANLDVARRTRFRDMNMNRIFNNEGVKSKFDQIGYEESARFSPSLRVGIDYDFNDRHSIGAMARLSLSESENMFRTDSYLQNPNPQEDQFIHAVNKSEGTFRNGTYNLHYTGKLDTVGSSLSANLDYVRLSSYDFLMFMNRFELLNVTAQPTTELLTSENPTSYNIYAAKADYTQTLSKTTKLELGAKASHVLSDNELRFYENADGRKLLDPNRSNHFVYKENIYAAYANISGNLGKIWSVQAGLRAEQTASVGHLLTDGSKTIRNYLDLFPSIFLQQKLSDDYQVSYKYSRRINRPYYENLNPFIFYLDPYTWAQGNPFLKPQYTNSFEVTQTLKQAYSLVLGYSLTKDFIAEVPYQNIEDNTTVFQQQNVQDLKNANATLVAPVRISKEWEINNTATVSYQRFKNNAGGENVVNDQLSFVAQSNHNVQLPYGLRLELSGGYQGPQVYGMYRINDMWWVDAGLKRSFKNDRLALTLNATDIFRSRQLFIATNLNGNINTMHQYQGAQSIRVNLRYRFNKGSEFETKKRNTNLDELDRTGGN